METCSESSVLNLARAAKRASAILAGLSAEQKSNALLNIAAELEQNADAITNENRKDLETAKDRVEKGELKDTLFQRLKLDKAKLLGTVAGIRQIAEMAEPCGVKTLTRALDDNLMLYRITCPIGVIAVIFESRPEAMPQILSLCLKTGNAIILKGGTEAERSNRILFTTMQQAAIKSGIPAESFALLETRLEINEILKAEGLVDLIIPRGSNELVRYIQSHTRIPVLGHADGICHVYVDKEADLEKAKRIVIDSKTQYPSACNAVETLLIHEEVLPSFLLPICMILQEKNVEIRLDKTCRRELGRHSRVELSTINDATDADWKTEYCDLIISIKAVSSLDEAIEHINKYGSGHTEAMVSENKASFDKFFAQVNSAGVYLNASTRFADGYRYGFGAEVGISTSRLHPRGPVGIEGLLTYKYQIIGNGQTVADYSGPQAKTFKHRDLKSE